MDVVSNYVDVYGNIIDGESDPSQERLDKIREKHNAGHKDNK